MLASPRPCTAAMFTPSQTCHGTNNAKKKADIGNEIIERCVKKVKNGIYGGERGMRITIRIRNLYKKMCLHRKKRMGISHKNVQQLPDNGRSKRIHKLPAHLLHFCQKRLNLKKGTLCVRFIHKVSVQQIR
jgi:hypothetical protein